MKRNISLYIKEAKRNGIKHIEIFSTILIYLCIVEKVYISYKQENKFQ